LKAKQSVVEMAVEMAGLMVAAMAVEMVAMRD
jgi:hypothetical protein